MELETLFLVSHSALDIRAVISAYHENRDHRAVKIVSATAENIEFFRDLKIPEEDLIALEYKCVNSAFRTPIGAFITAYQDKRMLDGLAAEMARDGKAELRLHCYDNDFQSGYLASVLAGRVKLSLGDTVGVSRHPFSSVDWPSLYFWKNLILLFIVRWVFGPLFILSGARDALLISFDLDRFAFDEWLEKRQLGTDVPEALKLKLIEPGRNIVVLYADSYGIDAAKHGRVYSELFESLSASDARIYVKLHPQTTDFPFPKSERMEFLPRHVPLEFIDLQQVTTIIGVVGGAMLVEGGFQRISLAGLLYNTSSQLYADLVAQFDDLSGIRFAESIYEISDLIEAD